MIPGMKDCVWQGKTVSGGFNARPQPQWKSGGRFLNRIGARSGLCCWTKASMAGGFVKAAHSAASSAYPSGGKFTGVSVMKIRELEHIIRAAGSISECGEIIVLGSQAILASFPNAPEPLLVSMEADVYPVDEPEKADLIDGSIGELSPFHQTYGYYAHGVGPETAVLPGNWKMRLVRLESPGTAGVIGWCLSPADLAAGKLLAGREKDFDFVQIMLQSGLVSAGEIRAVANELPSGQMELLSGRLSRLC